jgi:hypothetical protein
MDDRDYAAKYGKPYGDDKIVRMAKQCVDARHVAGKRGGYLSAAVQGDPVSVGGHLGGFAYSSPSFEGRVALAGLAGTGAKDLFVGIDGGLRFQTPTRLAPFVGVGTFLGYNKREVWGWRDGIDNDGDLQIDEPDEERAEYGFLAAVYPELGAHFWLNSRTRLTASGAYYVTTDGRDTDFWFFGLGIGMLLGGDP